MPGGIRSGVPGNKIAEQSFRKFLFLPIRDRLIDFKRNLFIPKSRIQAITVDHTGELRLLPYMGKKLNIQTEYSDQQEKSDFFHFHTLVISFLP